MNFKILTLAVASTAIVAMTGYSYAADSVEVKVQPVSEAADGSPVIISGKVGDIRDDEFDLVYTTGVITVELDRFGWSDNATDYLMQGENVTVRGYVDDDFFEGREIEATNVNLNENFVHYYAKDNALSTVVNLFENKNPDGVNLSVTGTVKSITGKNMVVINKNGTIPVDLTHFDYDPFDSAGMQQIDIGDQVYVYGQIDENFFNKKELKADGLIELVPM